MDTGSIIIGIIILILIIVPIAWAHIKRENHEKALLNKLKTAAGPNAGAIEQHDFWNSYAIAITRNGTISYLNTAEDTAVAVNLSEIKACRIGNTGKEFNGTVANINEVGSLELVLTQKQGSIVTLLFFKEEANLYVNEEIRLVKKWNELINSRLG